MRLFPSNVPKSKRAFDLVVSILGLIITFPVFLIILIWARVFNGKPVIFNQIRPGYHGEPFTLHKIRTMKVAYNSNGRPLPDDQRLTSFGRWLRATSLDELPELINVIRGEMSLVGPRPLLMQYLQRYSPEQARRHEVLPGITGWAQINGRNALEWEDKFSLDVWYVDNWSFLLDMKILFLTVWKVMTREGINQPGFTTAEEFMGKNRTE
jgi:sugar transferase EpsL